MDGWVDGLDELYWMDGGWTGWTGWVNGWTGWVNGWIGRMDWIDQIDEFCHGVPRKTLSHMNKLSFSGF